MTLVSCRSALLFTCLQTMRPSISDRCMSSSITCGRNFSATIPGLEPALGDFDFVLGFVFENLLEHLDDVLLRHRR